MQRSNVDVLREAYEAWNAEQVERIPEFFHPDAVFRPSGVFPGFEPVYHGYEGVAEFWRTITDPWEYFRIEIQDAEVRDAEILSRVRFVGRGAGSGAEVTVTFMHHVKFEEGGRIIEFSAHAPGDQPSDAVS